MNNNGAIPEAPAISQEDLATDARRKVIEERIALWRTGFLTNEVDYRVNMHLGDKEMAQAAKKQMVRCQKALDFLNEMLAALDAEAAKGQA